MFFCTWTDELVESSEVRTQFAEEESGSTEKGITIVWSDVAAGCPV